MINETVKIKDGKFKGFEGEVIGIKDNVVSLRIDELNVIHVPTTHIDLINKEYIIFRYNFGYQEIVKIEGKFKGTEEQMKTKCREIYNSLPNKKLLNIFAIELNSIKDMKYNFSTELIDDLFFKYIEKL